jgi:hypothetical protein
MLEFFSPRLSDYVYTTIVRLRRHFYTCWACIIKLITDVIYGLSIKQERLSLNTRIGWKGLPGTNTLAYYGVRTLRIRNVFMIQAPGAYKTYYCRNLRFMY